MRNGASPAPPLASKQILNYNAVTASDMLPESDPDIFEVYQDAARRYFPDDEPDVALQSWLTNARLTVHAMACSSWMKMEITVPGEMLHIDYIYSKAWQGYAGNNSMLAIESSSSTPQISS